MKWTRTREELEEVQNLMFGPFRHWGPAVVTMKDGETLRGCIIGASISNNAGTNLSRGRSAIVTSVCAEIRLLLDDRRTLVIPLLDVSTISE